MITLKTHFQLLMTSINRELNAITILTKHLKRYL